VLFPIKTELEDEQENEMPVLPTTFSPEIVQENNSLGRPKSQVWSFFTEILDAKERKVLKCKVCQKTYLNLPELVTLKYHMATKHPDLLAKFVQNKNGRIQHECTYFIITCSRIVAFTEFLVKYNTFQLFLIRNEFFKIRVTNLFKNSKKPTKIQL